MYQAEYWHSNFTAPMIAINGNITGQVYVNDFISFQNAKYGFGKVLAVEVIWQNKLVYFFTKDFLTWALLVCSY